MNRRGSASPAAALLLGFLLSACQGAGKAEKVGHSHTLSLSASGHGSIQPAVGVHAYSSGTSVNVTATPVGASRFAGWSGDASGTASSLTVVMDADKTLTATFAGADSALPERCTGQCDAVTPGYPAPDSTGALGNVTMYTIEASNGGACNYGVTNVWFFAAMSVNVEPGDGKGQWQHGRICGQCAEVTALTSQGEKSVVLRIMDKCPDGYCGIDLGGLAPAAIMLDGFGRYDGAWRFVSCTGHPEVSDGPPSLFVLNGSNSWWSRVQVRNPPSPVDSIAWQDADDPANHGTFPYAADPENTFEVPVKEVLQSNTPSLRITVRFLDGSTSLVMLSSGQLGAPSSAYPLGSPPEG